MLSHLFRPFDPHAATSRGGAGSGGSRRALPHTQVNPARIEQIANLFEVYLDKTGSEQELAGGRSGCDGIKHVSERPGSNARAAALRDVADNRVRFTAASLTVSKHSAIEAV